MEDFAFYFQLGWDHIISFDAIDHLLFIGALISLYHMRQWKQVLILVTAFTIGHSLTLALSSLNIIRFNNHLTEFLIPLTIFLTGLFNLLQKVENNNNIRLNYFLALFFGLIHGIGFANSIRFMLASQQTITFPLLSFNLGIEAGQIIVVSSLLFTALVFTDIIGIKQEWWKKAISVLCMFFALFMCIQRWPF
jgi:hypothetical protein